MIAVLARALAMLLVTQLCTAVLSWPLYAATRGLPRSRALALLGLLAAYHAALFYVVDAESVLLLGVVFAWLHLGFVFRFLSGIYYWRDGARVPPPGFHVALLMAGPRQHYGAGDWADLRGERLSLRLLGTMGRHFLYSLGVVSVAGALMALGYRELIPLSDIVVRSAFFIFGLEVLALCANLQTLAWSTLGYHQFIFGAFPWLRSRHIGQFWQTWNRVALKAFDELGVVLHTRRRYFLHTTAVFLASGVLHQLLVFYYTRVPSYGTLLSFALNGLLVYAFGRLYRIHRRLHPVVRALVFNPVTSAVVTLLACQPFVMDFYGAFVLPLG